MTTMVDTLRIRTSQGVTLTCDRAGDAGDRSPVLFLHGGGQTRHSWGSTAIDLAREGRECWSLDLRGHGDSDWAPDGDYSTDAMVEDVMAVLATIGRRPVLVGASMGGIVGLESEGRLHPGRLRALVLVDVATRLEDEGVARIVSFMSAAPDGFASLEDAADSIASYRNSSRPRSVDGLRKNLRYRDGRWHWHWDPAFLSDKTRSGRRDPEALGAAARALRVPTLLVRGRMSDMVSEESAWVFLEQCPHAEYRDIADAGHMVVGDRNDAFADAIRDFLDRLDAGEAVAS